MAILYFSQLWQALKNNEVFLDAIASQENHTITALMAITVDMAIAAITAITDIRAITASIGIRADYN